MALLEEAYDDEDYQSSTDTSEMGGSTGGSSDSDVPICQEVVLPGMEEDEYRNMMFVGSCAQPILI